MAHEIKSSDRFAEVRDGKVIFAGGGEGLRGRAWHGLGNEIEEGLSASEAFEQQGVNWSTSLIPLTAKIGEVELPTTFCAHVRDDLATGHEDKILGYVTDNYKPFENMDLAKLADELCGADAAVTTETMGTLRGGKRVFVLVRLPHMIEATRQDILQQYICISNGHGGTAQLSGYPTSIRVVCANTLRWSERDVAKGFKLRHTGDFDAKLKMARTMLGLATRASKEFELQVKALVGLRWKKAQALAYMNDLWEELFCGRNGINASDEETAARLIEKRDELVGTWMNNLDDSRQTSVGISGTAWAAYNAVSQWNDHERGRLKGIAESDARVHSNLFGVSQDHKLRAFRKALAAT